VGALGIHYPGVRGFEQASGAASQLGLPLSASEDYSTYSDATGAGCWARSLNLNVMNNFTSTISWYLVSAFSRGIIYDSDGFVRAAWPDSGHWEPTPTMWVTLHWSLFLRATDRAIFVATGNLTGGGTFSALAHPGGEQVTFIVEAMRYNESLCIRSNPAYYSVEDRQNVTLQLLGLSARSAGTSFAVWRSCISWQYGAGDFAPEWFQFQGLLQVDAGSSLHLTVEANCIYTISNKLEVKRPVFSASKPQKPFPLPYFDDFEQPIFGKGAKFFGDLLGKFEIVGGGKEGKGFAFAQMVTEYLPISNNCPAHWFPFTAIGDMFFKDLSMSVDVALGPETDGRPIGAYIAMRTREWRAAAADGAFREKVPGLFFWLNRTGWRLCSDNACFHVISDGHSRPMPDAVSELWRTMRLDVLGQRAWGWLDGVLAFEAVAIPGWNSTIGPSPHDTRPFPFGLVPDSGWAGLGSTFSSAKFDNVNMSGMHNAGHSAVVPCASSPPAPKDAVGSFPCSHAAFVEWTVAPDFRVHVAFNESLCLVVGSASDPLVPNATLVELGSCAATSVLYYDSVTGRVLQVPSRKGSKHGLVSLTRSDAPQPVVGVDSEFPLCMDVRPADSGHEARAVMLPCGTLPHPSQQFQYSGGKSGSGVLRMKMGSCLSRGYTFSVDDDWDNYRDCCIGLCAIISVVAGVA
jgi:hypothetical protein